MEFTSRFAPKGENDEGGGRNNKGEGSDKDKATRETTGRKREVSKEAMVYLSELKAESQSLRDWLFGEGRDLFRPIVEAQQKRDKLAYRQAKNQLWGSFKDKFSTKPNLSLKASATEVKGHELAAIHTLLAKNFHSGYSERETPARRFSPTEASTILDLRYHLQDNLSQFWLSETMPDEPSQNPFRLSIWIEKVNKAVNAILKTINELSTKP